MIYQKRTIVNLSGTIVKKASTIRIHTRETAWLPGPPREQLAPSDAGQGWQLNPTLSSELPKRYMKA